MPNRSTKRCAACGSAKDLTKHHVYPRYLRDLWRDKLQQIILILCHTCHAVVHYPGGCSLARAMKQHEFVQRFCDPQLQKVIGPCRKIIRDLERDSRTLHLGELL